MVCDLVVVVVEWRCTNVARIVLLLRWWRWLYSNRSNDSVMLFVCYLGSSGGVVVYMVTAILVVDGACVHVVGIVVMEI